MNKKFAAIGAALFAFAVPVSSSPAFGAPAPEWPTVPPTDKIIIDVATVNGTGCPPGTAAVAVSPDNEAFTVTYSEYTAQVGVGSTPTDFRKNCQINLKVHVPQGFTYGIASADYRGFASLEKGATALQRARYYFQGNSPTQFVDHTFKGPFVEDWQKTDTTEVGAIVYKPCGESRNFNINTQLRVDAGTSDPKKTTSFITMDSTDGNIQTTYHFAWKKCPK
ncbi:DUF4360 domain-containing protein [Nocardia sp. CDC159]|uniref:DUF4360 domain-containing protein n=1 Tax=Nocardia pulmonis TaxID=2951408 RepID=A0A9X2EEL9_9NOCA|nr:MULTISPECIES: DUF4360 domain-containing protein [Nocardia]MCM6779074.1 DUF4360 domain-containing protein [Nocardia pulmonis]MCM6791964.1 DUF4360 domain-containing protein [Nocardia sp. CDC159]